MDSPFPHLELTKAMAGMAMLAALLTWESCKPFFPFFDKHTRWRGEHLVRNLAVGLLNVALIAAGFSYLWMICID